MLGWGGWGAWEGAVETKPRFCVPSCRTEPVHRRRPCDPHPHYPRTGSTAPRASLFGWRMDEEGVAPRVSLMVAPRIGGLPSLRCPSVALAQGTGSEDRAGDDKEKLR